MALWMAVALAQVLALPGWLLVRALRLDRDGPLPTIFLSFALSLVANHFLVIALTLLGAYTRPVLVAVVAAELALLVALRRRSGAQAGAGFAERALAWLGEGPGAGARLWLLLGALCAAAYLAALVPENFTRVFEKWDAVLSWNRWANDWAAGSGPFWIAHYPQLLPSVWSVFYVLQGAPLEFLPRGMMALFPLAIVLVFLDLGLRRREPEPFLAAVLVTVLLARALGPWLGAGLADVPVAFFALLALHPLYAGPLGQEPRAEAPRLAAATLAAIGCGLTKQTGLWVAGLLPVFVLLRLGARPGRRWLRAVAGMAAGLGAGILPWYAWAEYRIAQGMERSELPHITDAAHRGADLFERAARAFGHWHEALPLVVLVPIGVLVLASLARPWIRWTTILVSVPFTAVWALLASYSIRNVALALPFLALSAAHGAGVLAAAAARSGPARARRAARAGALAALLALFGLAFARLDPARVQAAHDGRLARVGKPELNERILEFQRREGFEGRILTNYRWAEALPGLRERIFINRGAQADAVWPFQGDGEGFARLVADPENDIRFILVTDPIASRSVARHLHEGIASGAYRVEFRSAKGMLLRVVPGPGAAGGDRPAPPAAERALRPGRPE